MSGAAEEDSALRHRLSSLGPFLLVVAGPNGAGKTTFVERYVKPIGFRTVNPDQIAHALAPEAPNSVAYEAAQLAETVSRNLVSRRISFCRETVFSDPQTSSNASSPQNGGRA